MVVPKRRLSRSRIHSRRSQWKAVAPRLSTCEQCRAPKLSHVACPHCGTYRRRQVIGT